MSQYERPVSPNGYRIAVICALQIEADAVEDMFDEDWEKDHKYPELQNDPNTYTMGRIGEHNVVLAHMPGIGKANSANVAGSFRMSFPEIRLGLVVGICGGMPFIREHPNPSEPREVDVFLGDVIISTEVFQYDLGHQFSDTHIPTDTIQNMLGRPNPKIRSFLRKMGGIKGRARLEHKTRDYLDNMLEKKGFEKWKYQGVEKDILYKSDYLHKHRQPKGCDCTKSEDSVCQKARRELTCEDLECSSEPSVIRRTRLKEVADDAPNQANASNKSAMEPSPHVHFGKVASGDSVVKSATHRDELAESHEIIGFEMEGAGAWDSMPIVVIKSVVDYADSHKSYLWQKYGAACGAACMKAVMSEWRVEEIRPLLAEPIPHDLPERQTGEASGSAREKSENRSNSKDRDKRVENDVDNAYALFENQSRTRADLEAALRILSMPGVELKYLESSLRRRIYWGLMTVEKELSCFEGLDTVKKMGHINKARRYCTEVEEIVSQFCDASLAAQVSLERHIIEGKKALLDFKLIGDVDKLKRSKSEAKNGIDASLGKLREVDPRSYDEVSEAAKVWRKKFSL